MSDLRDRIAAVLYRTYPPYQLGYAFGCPTEKWEDESERYRDVYRRDADAVIAELGLKQISETGEIADRDGGEPIRYGRYRYVTDWLADE